MQQSTPTINVPSHDWEHGQSIPSLESYNTAKGGATLASATSHAPMLSLTSPSAVAPRSTSFHRHRSSSHMMAGEGVEALSSANPLSYKSSTPPAGLFCEISQFLLIPGAKLMRSLLNGDCGGWSVVPVPVASPVVPLFSPTSGLNTSGGGRGGGSSHHKSAGGSVLSGSAHHVSPQLSYSNHQHHTPDFMELFNVLSVPTTPQNDPIGGVPSVFAGGGGVGGLFINSSSLYDVLGILGGGGGGLAQHAATNPNPNSIAAAMQLNSISSFVDPAFIPGAPAFQSTSDSVFNQQQSPSATPPLPTDISILLVDRTYGIASQIMADLRIQPIVCIHPAHLLALEHALAQRRLPEFQKGRSW